MKQIEPDMNGVFSERRSYAVRKEFIDTNKPVLKQSLTVGNNPMVGATVACAVAVEEAMK